MSTEPKRTYRRSGWRQLKEENEHGFESNFAPLRVVMRSGELVGSIVELFVSAIAGIGRIGLGGSPPEPDETPGLLPDDTNQPEKSS